MDEQTVSIQQAQASVGVSRRAMTRWRDGFPKRSRYDYPTVYRPDHPRASASGEVYIHLLVAEAALGRHLPSGAEVHHLNEDTADPRPRNLVICQDRQYHKLLHVRTRIVRAGGNPNTDAVCSRDTITCGHCQRIVLVKPGTGSTVYLFPQWQGPDLEEAGAIRTED